MTRTKGDVIIEEIQIGDVHYEFEYGFYIKSTVVTKPVKNGEMWTWTSKTDSGTIINYSQGENMVYALNIYTYMAYQAKPL